MKQPFSILKEDAQKAKGSYNSDECGFFHAFKRQYPDIKISEVGTQIVLDEEANLIAQIEHHFLYGNFRDIIDNGKEFHTTIEFL